ncbi:MAG TPA: winged helix-turn-helix domain-containing protein [Nitrososphaera sp.]|nr:winged helix-turn-helix domain-containing protein [Nitrososphaera sp.]
MVDSHYEPRIERHRSKVDIVYDILVSAMGGGAKKTHILYKANISSTQAETYFSALLVHNLLEKTVDIDDNNIYRTTEKGMKFIECCEEIRSLIGIVLNNRRIDPMSDFYAFGRRRH